MKVLLSDEEDAQIRARAATLDVSVPRLMVESALADGSPPTRSERHGRLAEFAGARRLVAKVGNDLGQGHSSDRAGAQWEATLQLAATALARLDRAVEELRR